MLFIYLLGYDYKINKKIKYYELTFILTCGYIKIDLPKIFLIIYFFMI
jgi:hypothetical protein